jgi:hypothetical protein
MTLIIKFKIKLMQKASRMSMSSIDGKQSVTSTNTSDSNTTATSAIIARNEAQVYGQRVTVEEMKQVTRTLTFDKSMLKHLNEVG